MKTKKQLELTIPQSWDDISLTQFQQLEKLVTQFDLEAHPESILDYRLHQATILNPAWTREELGKQMTMENLTTYFQAIEFIHTQPVLHDCQTLSIAGKTYTFQEFKGMNMEQWIDTEKYASLEQCHRLIAIFYIDPTEYSDAELEKVSSWLAAAPVTQYFWSASFFLFMHRAFGLSIELFTAKLAKHQRKIDRTIQVSQKIQKKWQQLRKKIGFKSSSMPTPEMPSK